MPQSHRLLGYQLLGAERGREGEREEKESRGKGRRERERQKTGRRTWSTCEQHHEAEEEKAPYLSIIQGREAQGSR